MRKACVNQCVMRFKAEFALVILRARGQEKSFIKE
jgi:hypothetical protein